MATGQIDPFVHVVVALFVSESTFVFRVENGANQSQYKFILCPGLIKFQKIATITANLDAEWEFTGCQPGPGKYRINIGGNPQSFNGAMTEEGGKGARESKWIIKYRNWFIYSRFLFLFTLGRRRLYNLGDPRTHVFRLHEFTEPETRFCYHLHTRNFGYKCIVSGWVDMDTHTYT